MFCRKGTGQEQVGAAAVGRQQRERHACRREDQTGPQRIPPRAGQKMGIVREDVQSG